MDAIRCPQCLEELQYLHEPRVFCLPCLETLKSVKAEDSQPCGEEIHCTICRLVHFISIPYYAPIIVAFQIDHTFLTMSITTASLLRLISLVGRG